MNNKKLAWEWEIMYAIILVGIICGFLYPELVSADVIEECNQIYDNKDVRAYYHDTHPFPYGEGSDKITDAYHMNIRGFVRDVNGNEIKDKTINYHIFVDGEGKYVAYEKKFGRFSSKSFKTLLENLPGSSDIPEFQDALKDMLVGVKE